MIKEKLQQALEVLIDPSCEKSLKETKGLKFIAIDDEANTVNLIVALDKVEDQYKHTLTRHIAKVVKLDFKFTGVKIDYELLKKTGSLLDKKRKLTYIGVASGKGGVGKSTVTANLAMSLARLGKKVGIIDADIYGASIPTIFNMEVVPPKANSDEKIIPFKEHGIELISTEFFMQENTPLMWRGPMLGKMLNHFFYDVAWSEDLEYIIVDLPPGTGDVAIDIQKLIPECLMLIVTTPHASASHVAVKAGFAAKELKHTIVGVIENMSYFKHHDERIPVFGEGGGQEVANKLSTDLIAQIPIGNPESGHHSLFDMHEEIGIIYLGLANKLLKY